jgi:hypothetical protein
MRIKRWHLLWIVSLALVLTGGLFTSVQAAAEQVPKVGPVKVNPHPASLEGKTILLRWNGKMNGDKYLTRVGELITQQVKGVKIIKMWEAIPGSNGYPMKDEHFQAALKLKPDLVVAAQAD